MPDKKTRLQMGATSESSKTAGAVAEDKGDSSARSVEPEPRSSVSFRYRDPGNKPREDVSVASKAVAAVTAEEEAEAARVAMHGPLQVQLRSGQSFGELAFVTAHKRNATVIALQECHLIKIDVEGYSNTKSFNSDSLFNISESQKQVMRLLPRKRTKEHIENCVSVLSNHTFFECMSTIAVKHICKHMHLHKVPGGFKIFEEGDPGTRYYIIVSGSVSFHKRVESVARKPRACRRMSLRHQGIVNLPLTQMEGHALELTDAIESMYGNCVACFYSGAGFGEKALAVLHDPRRATAITREVTQLLVIDRECVRSAALVAYPELDVEQRDYIVDLFQRHPEDRKEPEFQRAQEVLAELDFFKKLHYDLQVDVIRACGFTSTPANSALFRQGDPVSLVYILLRGSVSVHTLGEKFHERVSAKDMFRQDQKLKSVKEESTGNYVVVSAESQAQATYGPCIRLLLPGCTLGELTAAQEEQLRVSGASSLSYAAKAKMGHSQDLGITRWYSAICYEDSEFLTLSQEDWRAIQRKSSQFRSDGVQSVMLRRLPMLKHHTDLLLRLVHLMRFEAAVANTLLIDQGAHSEELLIIKSGRCQLYMHEKTVLGENAFEEPHRSGAAEEAGVADPVKYVRRVPVGTLSDTEMYGAFEYFLSLDKYQCTVVSTELVQLYAVKAQMWMDIVYPELRNQLEQAALRCQGDFVSEGKRWLAVKQGRMRPRIGIKEMKSPLETASSTPVISSTNLSGFHSLHSQREAMYNSTNNRNNAKTLEVRLHANHRTSFPMLQVEPTLHSAKSFRRPSQVAQGDRRSCSPLPRVSRTSPLKTKVGGIRHSRAHLLTSEDQPLFPNSFRDNKAVGRRSLSPHPGK